MEGARVTFGKVLREKRIGRGLTQKELADLASVDDSYISQLERDYKFPSARTIENLAQALGVEVAELLAMYFPAGEAKATPAFVGRKEAAAAFDEWLAGNGGVLAIRGGPGFGKTAFINERIIPRCRDEKSPYVYFDSRRLASYRGFLKDLRDAFAARRGGYRAFDEIYEQCGSIERRLRGRFQDPFSLQVAGGAAEPAREAEAELTYAEKYIYREAERLLTDEFLAGFRVAARDFRRAVVILDDFHGVGATVGYWVGQFLERLREAGVPAGKLAFAVAVEPRTPLAASLGAARTLELGALSPAEVEEYVHARGLKLGEAEGELISSLKGDVRALKYWGDYFEAAALFGANRLGLAEDELRRLDEELQPLVAEGLLKKGRLLSMEARRLLGHLTRLQGRLAEAADYYESAAALAEGLPDARPADLGYLYLDLGHVCRHRGRWDEAIEYYGRARDEFGRCGEKIGEGVAHSSTGTAFRLKRKFARAKQEYRQATVILEGLKNRGDGAVARRWLASTLSNYGIALRLEAEELRAAGDAAAARKALEKAKAMCEEAVTVSDDAAETAVAENRFGLCLSAAGRWRREEGAAAEAADLLAEATRRHKRALSAFEDLGDLYRVAQVLADLSVAAAQQGLLHDAIINFKNSLAIFQQMGSRYHAAKVLVELGLLSEGGEQLSYFAEALAAARGHNDESLAEIAAAVKAALLAGDGARARRFFEEQKAADAAVGRFFAEGA
jgi:transcriptional regulator with XRE-family HTH domain/tetratricopeptide (TPR) repeat protein